MVNATPAGAGCVARYFAGHFLRHFSSVGSGAQSHLALPNNRSYLRNQLISLALAFGCGVLALLSIAMTAGNVALMEFLLRGHGSGFIRLVGFVVMKVFAIATSIGIFFLIYWLLPNGKVPARAVLPTAIIMGLLAEALKYGYILALPWLNFAEVYGPFALSVSMMFWAFLTGLLLLAGANLSAEDYRPRSLSNL